MCKCDQPLITHICSVRPWLKDKIIWSVVKYQHISHQISYNWHRLKHLHMNSHHSKCVAFAAFAFWHRVPMWVQLWFFILCKLVATCHLQTFYNLSKQVAKSCWNNHLATSLLTTCNKPVDKLKQTCCRKLSQATHPDIGLLSQVVARCPDLLQLARFWLCRVISRTTPRVDMRSKNIFLIIKLTSLKHNDREWKQACQKLCLSNVPCH